MSDLTDIMHEVFERRMGGNPAVAGPRHVDVLASWLDAIPAYPASPSGSAAQIAHGQQLFESAETGCTKCHNGAHYTNNQTVDIGTGQPFQVPTLVGVAARAPYMHDGCAATLADRFDSSKASCNGGENHGNTAQLSTSDVADLIAFLETL
jgi:cytochrome c peroxidase